MVGRRMRASVAGGLADRRFAFSRLHSLGRWPAEESIPGEPFCLLLLMSNNVEEQSVVETFAERSIRQGMRYFSVWGLEATWVEDIVDGVFERVRTIRDMASLVTTAHSDLDEAISFFKQDAIPPAESRPCHLWWVAAVGSDIDASLVRNLLGMKDEIERIDLEAL